MGFNLGVATGKIIIDAAGAKQGFGVAGDAARAFYGVVEEKVDSVRKLSTTLTAVGTAGAGGLGVAVHAAADFEASLSAVKAVSGATDAQMEQLRQTALRIGKDTKYSATEASNAMEELTKAGVSTNDILSGAADATVNLAAAGEIDLPRAAEIAAAAINNFGIKGKELPHVADLIAGAANASAIDVGDFGYSLSQAGAVANLTGLKFDDLAVAIAEMGQAGIKGSDAGTSIKTFLSNLIPTTNQQIGLFEELGLQTFSVQKAQQTLRDNGVKPLSSDSAKLTEQLQKLAAKLTDSKVGSSAANKEFFKLGQNGGFMQNAFFKADGTMKSFREVQEVLQKSTKNLTKEQKLNTLGILFGSDAIRASAVFADQGAKGFDGMANSMGKVTAASVAKTRLDNFNGSVENLKGTLETAQIIIGETFLPILRKFVDALTAAINVFNNLPAPVQKAIGILLGAGTVFSLTTGLIIKLTLALVPMIARFLGMRALSSVFSIFVEGFKVWRSGAGIAAALAGSVGRAGVVFTKFARFGTLAYNVLVKFPRILAILRTAATVAFGPWGIAIALVVAALVILYKKFQPFHDLVDNVAKAIKEGIGVALDYVNKAIQAFVQGFSDGTDSATGFIGFMQDLGNYVQLAWQGLKALADLFVTILMPALKDAGENVLVALNAAWQILSATWTNTIQPALAQLWESFKNLLPALQELWTQLQPVLKVLGILALVVVGVVVVAIVLLTVTLAVLLNIIIRVASYIIQTVIVVFALLLAVVEAVIGVFVRMAAVVVDSIGGLATTIAGMVHGIVEVFQGMWKVISGLFTGDWQKLWDGVKQIFSGFRDIFVSLIKGMITNIVGLITGFIKSIISFFTGLYNTLVGHSIIPDLINAIVKWFASLPGKVLNYVTSMVTNVVNKMTSMATGMVKAVVNGLNNVVKTVGTIKSRVTGALSGAGSWLLDAGRKIIQGLIDGISSRVASLRNKLSSVTKLIPSWKGPADVDAKLLSPNGQLIMQSLIDGFQKKLPNLESTLRSVTKAIPTEVTANLGARPVSSAARTQPALTPSQFREAISVTNNWQVYNPVAEKSSITITREATRRANLGVLS